MFADKLKVSNIRLDNMRNLVTNIELILHSPCRKQSWWGRTQWRVLRRPECRQVRRPGQQPTGWKTVGKQQPAQQCFGRVPASQQQQGRGGPQGHGAQQEHDGRREHGAQQEHDGRRVHGALQGHDGEQHGDCAVTGGTLRYRDEPDRGTEHWQLRDDLPEYNNLFVLINR